MNEMQKEMNILTMSFLKQTPLLLMVFLLLFLSTVSHAQPIDDDDANRSGSEQPTNPAAAKLLTQMLFNRFSNFSAILSKDMLQRLDFCIEDAEWNAAFNFSKNTDFLSECLQTTKDVTQRLCTAAEVKLYGNSLLQVAEAAADGKSSRGSTYIEPNKNCNLSAWPSGCEPGWACGTGQTGQVDLKNSKTIPTRIYDCKPCCAGFFCPSGLTCMIPCPLGSYCPTATLNKTTGVCDPYKYQLPPGQPNITCGGADIWADYMSGPEVFCSAGFYCPTSTQKIPCSRGHYCRVGSTEQTRCYQLATCEPQTENQNITAYGLMFFGAITLILLIIYNCSGQVLSTRERRQAKSREAAARSARETAQARERWKSAKDTAKKHATGLQAQLSRTFSRKKSAKDASKGPAQPKPGSDAALPPMPAGEPKKGKKGQSNLTKMLQDLEDNPDGPEGFNMDIGDKNLKKNMAKQLHTRSQIFKYAYGQIEKEKAMQEQNKNLTFSGVISMTNDMDILSRPPIEVYFQDLTLTLSGKNKHLLRSVTGKLVPGHVSAVMGPSGAGKTTFLSALTGKAAGCTITGSILINGKDEPMQSYKKIIGYVPQDDIVHGNLTVEENLWFSARCRLAAELSKPERVLIVERVIESLGLQAVRDSLVGTVEKRGISGGQRKRVNVGLEMVMEPSLLILDEPTSGLDSSSSQLLLRALRREALEGVNICMVVHQPSYTLFKMFDDLILLAKSGLTVYHGPVKKVEEYFGGLGINVPERVNPPDYFIDILEGIIKLNASSGIKCKELPLRWMLHNGYPVPPDMLDSAGLHSSSLGDSTHGSNRSTDAGTSDSFAGDLWQDVKFNVQQQKDHIRHNYNKLQDLSNRETPSILQQYKYFVGRVGKQRLREARIQAVDYLILLLAGICLGTIAKVSDETFGSTGYLYTVIAVSLLSKISAMRSFSLDKLHYWRESSSGMSSLAYFMAKDTIDHFNTIVKPAVYLSMFYFFNNPRSTIFDNYLVLLCLVYCVTGIAYVLAIYLEPGPAQLWAVLLPVVLTLIANQEGDDFLMRLGDFCYTKWALEAFLIANAKRHATQTFHCEAYHSPNAYSSPQNSLGNLGYYGLYGNSPVMQSTPEHVLETQADEMADEEEVVIVKQPSSRKKPLSKELVDKWTPAENTALISAYIQVSTCSIVGTNQRKIGIWGKVAELICETAKERPGVIRPRTHASCKGRYSRIQELVNKFSGHYAAAERLLGNASGYNESDVLTKAHELYEEDKGATFPLEYCWRMMEEQPKWAQTQPQPRPAKKNVGKGKTKACDTSLSTGNQPSGGSEKRNNTDVDGHYTESIPTSDEVNTSDKRPIGRDAAKAAAKGKGKNVGYSSSSSTHAETMQNYSASIDMFTKNQATAIEFEREKANWQRQERRENLLSTLLQKEILGKELSQKEQEVKEKLLNYLDIA